MESTYVEVGYPIGQGLQPGLDEDTIRGRLHALGLEPPDEVVTVFQWHDGYRTPEGAEWDGWLGPGLMAYSLEQACKEYEELAELASEAMDLRDGAPYDWFPVFRKEGWFCVIAVWDSTGRLGFADWSGDDLDAELPTSLTPSVQKWAHLIRTGGWRMEPPGDWTINLDGARPLVE